MSRFGRPAGPWYGRFSERLRFEGRARVRFPDLVGRQDRQPGKRGWKYTLTVDVPHYEMRQVEIRFQMPAPKVPIVFSDGPESPHRYADGALCMWYPFDPAELRWVFDEGLEQLVGHVAVHLFRESWWREHGEWLGDEAPHDRLGTAFEASRSRAA